MDSNFINQLLNERQVSEWLGISLPSLQRLRSNGAGPRFIQLSERRIGYRASAVEGWLDTRTISRVGALSPAPQGPKNGKEASECPQSVEGNVTGRGNKDLGEEKTRISLEMEAPRSARSKAPECEQESAS
jgi:predicted DNA-binding transcriptional regulator AlpA